MPAVRVELLSATGTGAGGRVGSVGPESFPIRLGSVAMRRHPTPRSITTALNCRRSADAGSKAKPADDTAPLTSAGQSVTSADQPVTSAGRPVTSAVSRSASDLSGSAGDLSGSAGDLGGSAAVTPWTNIR